MWQQVEFIWCHESNLATICLLSEKVLGNKILCPSMSSVTILGKQKQSSSSNSRVDTTHLFRLQPWYLKRLILLAVGHFHRMNSGVGFLLPTYYGEVKFSISLSVHRGVSPGSFSGSFSGSVQVAPPVLSSGPL